MTDSAAVAEVPLRLSFKGWLGIWVGTGIVVLGTLIAFLLGIVGDLESIDHSLAEAASAVGGAGGNVKPLPGHIEDVNTRLTQIDEALKPVPASADDIAGSLGAIKGNLEKVDGSLGTTGGSLVTTSGALGGTSGSLSDTSGALVTTAGLLLDTASILTTLSSSLSDTANVLNSVKSTGSEIEGVLQHTQHNPEGLGTENIWMRADATLAIRAAAIKDSESIVIGIRDANVHLKSICNRIPGTASC
jgi:ABC-type transporter Mla subunit MlaD